MKQAAGSRSLLTTHGPCPCRRSLGPNSRSIDSRGYFLDFPQFRQDPPQVTIGCVPEL